MTSTEDQKNIWMTNEHLGEKKQGEGKIPAHLSVAEDENFGNMEEEYVRWTK